jgi:hypothetical protein
VNAAIGTLERYRPTDAARQDYLASFEGERFAESMRYVRTYPEQLPVLRDLLPTIETPVCADHYTMSSAISGGRR